MADARKQDETAALVHWTYSRDEWKTFVRWKTRKKGFFHFLLHLLSLKKSHKTPGIIITPNRVSIDNNHEPFLGESRQLKRINIRDTGEMNVMEIGYEISRAKGAISQEIHIPVPKGKLREAIEVQERLNAKKELI
jgi:hypothetical protein